MARRFNRKPLTDEQRDARRKADRDRIEQAARALLTTDGWQRWIRVRASNGLSRYSVSNQMLIAIDGWSRGITPTYVAGFRAFLASQPLSSAKARGRSGSSPPSPSRTATSTGEETGEKRCSSGPSRSSTSSMTDPLPGKQPVPLAPPREPITGDSHHHLIAPLIAHAAQLGYTVEIRDLPEHGPGGWCDPERREIVVAPDPPTSRSAR